MFVLTFTDGVVKWSPMDRLAIDERLRRWETPGPSIDPVDGSEQPF
jgi:hypothetical protein